MKKYAALCLALAWCAGVAQANPIITVGDHPLLPNMANQQVLVYVGGGTAVQGVEVECQIADGGPLGNGSITGPAITNLDVITGTIFANNNVGSFGTPNGVLIPQEAKRGTTAAADYVVASGLLATVTIDTTGFFTVGQTWELRLKNTLDGDTVFGDIAPIITNGTISIATAVPEPGTLALAVAGAGMLWWRRKAAGRPEA